MHIEVVGLPLLCSTGEVSRVPKCPIKTYVGNRTKKNPRRNLTQSRDETYKTNFNMLFYNG